MSSRGSTKKFADHVKEAERLIPIIGDFDVIVCGGGASGFLAALASARQGARTILIEKNGYLGGTATAGLMVEFGSIHNGKAAIIGGITHEFLHNLIDYGGAYFTDSEAHSMIFDPESMIMVCQRMIVENKVNVLLHSQICSPIVNEGKVSGVILENKSGRQAVRGKVLIDCTGDGDVAARAGADYAIGRQSDRRVQPASIEVIVGNVNTTRLDYTLPELIPRIKKARAQNALTIPTNRLFSWGRVIKKDAPDDPSSAFFFLNATNVLNCDGTSAESLTAAEIDARNQVSNLIDFLRGNAPGFEKCYLDRTAAQIGIRESRRIVCDYILTEEDVLSARHFPDGVTPACNSIDVHDVHGEVFDHKYLAPGTNYEIPYRCLVPKALDGILVSGRCISTDHQALGSIRVMVVCMPLGDACGKAAAMAADLGVSPRGIPVSALQEKIRSEGTLI